MRDLVRVSGVLFAADCVAAGLQVALGILVARILGVQGYGFLSLVIVAVTVVNQVVDCKIREAVVKFGADAQAAHDDLRLVATVKVSYLLNLATGALAFIAITLAAPWIGERFIHMSSAAVYLPWYALTILAMVVEGPSHGVLTLYRRFGSLAAYAVVASALRLGIVGWTLVRHGTVAWVIGGYVLTAVVSNAVIFVMALCALRPAMSWQALRTNSLGMLHPRAAFVRFVAFTNLNELLAIFTRNFDVLILGYFRPLGEVGWYRLAKNFAETFAMIAPPVTTAAYPRLAAAWASAQKADFREVFFGMTKLLARWCVPAAVVLCLASPWLVRYTAGSAYAASVPAFQVMLIGATAGIVFVLVRPALLAMQRPHVMAALSFAAAVCMLCASFAFIPGGGYLATAYVYVIPLLVYHGGAFIYVKRHAA